MEITSHALWSLIHGMGFGGLYLLACSGAIVAVWSHFSSSAPLGRTQQNERFLQLYLGVMMALAWLAVLSGTYIVYPWYRATPPIGVVNLAGYPQPFLLANPSTAAWHSIGMEWKEYVAWLVPISITMVFAITVRYGRSLGHYPALRRTVLCFLSVSLVAAGIAGFFGAELNGHTGMQGGRIFHIVGK